MGAHSVKKKLLALAALSSFVAAPALSFAVNDYSGIVTSITAEVGAAVVDGLPVMGLVLATFVGLRIIRRMAKG